MNKDSTLQEIVGPWEESSFSSGLIERCRLAWRKPVGTLNRAELATLLRQKIAIHQLLPLAKEKIASVDDDSEMYEGELAAAISGVDEAFRLAPEGWQSVSGEVALGFENELTREVVYGHSLYCVRAKCIARRQSRDDFVFEVSSELGRIAVVHLTWRREDNPEWPSVTWFNDFDDFYSNWRRIFE